MINRIFKNKYFLFSIQLLTLIAFCLIILGAFNVTTDDPKFAKVLRNTNLSNLIIWSYWWPLIIVSAILFGRFWCTICPMEFVVFLASKIGLKKKPGKILQSGWIITLFYGVILIIGIHTLAIHRIPRFMAFYMIILFAVALFSGLIWEKRTFCTYICPIGHLLGLYSLMSFGKLRVKDKNVCQGCKTKDCIAKDSHYKLLKRSCTSEIYPAKISDNRDCILCGQCFKSCSKDNIAIGSRKVASDLFSAIKLSSAEITFFMIVSSFVIYEVLTEWSGTKKYVLAIPDKVNHLLNTSGSTTGTVKALVLFIVLPLVFYGFFAVLKKIFGKESLSDSFGQLVIVILPITACMHLLKATLKTTSRIPYWHFALSDTVGVKSANLIMENSSILDKGLLHSLSPVISVIAVVLPIVGFVLSLLIIRKQIFNNFASRLISIVAVFLYGGLFIFSLTAWKVFS